jgi:hypothetical protein
VSDMGFQQMERDGIKRLPKWGKPVRDVAVTYRRAIPRVACCVSGCSKKAGYSTRQGTRCFEHALETCAIADPARGVA